MHGISLKVESEYHTKWIFYPLFCKSLQSWNFRNRDWKPIYPL